MIAKIEKIRMWLTMKRLQGAWTPLTGHLPKKGSFGVSYGRRVFRVLLEAAVLLAVTVIGFMGLLFLFESFWVVYQNTYIGQRFAIMHEGDLPFLNFLRSADIPSFCVELSLWAFVICMGVSAVCRLFEISPYLYDSRGFAGQLGFWGLPLAAVLSTRIHPMYALEHSMTAMILAAIPTLAMVRQCFRFSYELFPEISDILRPFPRPQRAWEIVRQVLLLILIGAITTAGILYVAKLIGQAEIVMLVGWRFIPDSPEWGLIPFALSEIEICIFSMMVALVAISVCAVGAVLCQFAHIPRRYYLDRSYIIQVASMGAPLMLATAFWIRDQLGIDTIETSLILAIAPVMCMFHGCIRLANELVPEAGDIYRLVTGKPMKMVKAAPYDPDDEWNDTNEHW